MAGVHFLDAIIEIKKMPLKQGTERMFCKSSMSSYYKKDAPKAGDGKMIFS